MKLRALLFAFLPALLLVPSFAHAQIPKPSCTISASSGSVTVGQTTNLTWQSFNATAGNITSLGSVNLSGTQGVIPTPPQTTYVATFTGPGGTGVCSTIVAVGAGSGLNSDNGNSGGGSGIQSTGQNPILQPSNNQTGTGLVPCNGIGCEACSLAELAQRIMNWIIGLTIPLAAAMIAWAGILYFTSLANPKQIEQAHTIFKNVGIGFLIVLGAWLGVQTILKAVLDPTYYQSWNTIQCVQGSINGTGRRQLNQSIGNLIGMLPGLNSYNPNNANNISVSGGGSAFGNTCPDGSAPSVTESGNFCNTANGVVPAQSSNTVTRGNVSGIYNCPKGYTIDSGQGYVDSDGNPVNSVSCVQTDASGNVTDELSPSCGGGYSIQNGSSNIQDGSYTGKCVNSSGFEAPVLTNQVLNGQCVGDLSPDALSAAASAGGYPISDAQANGLSCVGRFESACGTNTRTAYTPGGQPTSASGPLQIVFGAGKDAGHNLNVPGCTEAAQKAGYDVSGNLNCSQYFSGGVCKGGQYATGCGACQAASMNVSCYGAAAGALVKDAGGLSPWTADSRASGQTSCINSYR